MPDPDIVRKFLGEFYRWRVPDAVKNNAFLVAKWLADPGGWPKIPGNDQQQSMKCHKQLDF